MGRRGIKKMLNSVKAMEYEKIQKAMPELIGLANVHRIELIKKVGSNEATYYRKLRLSCYSAHDVISYFKAIIEIKNDLKNTN